MDGEFAVIEKANKVWILFDVIDRENCCLFDSFAILSLDIVDLDIAEYMDDALGSVAEAQLQEMLPIMADIYDACMVDVSSEK